MSSRRFAARSIIPAKAEELYDWHMRPGALARLCPPWDRLRIVSGESPPSEGSRVVIEMALGPLKQRWVALHRGFVRGSRFEDVMQRGPFARWHHVHRFDSAGEGRARLSDEIEYALPAGPLGSMLLGGWTRSKLRRTFSFRHQRTRADLSRHGEFLDRPRLHVALTGASGLVGSSLLAFLETGGHRVTRLVRRRPRGDDEIAWDPAAGRIDAEALEGLDAVVHLAGANIASGRWTPARKQRIRDSRVDGTRLLASALVGLKRRPRTLICASAIGFYGDRGEQRVDEDSDPGSGFLADVAREWEDAVRPAETCGMRVVRLRIGVVLSAAGGALATMLPPFRFGVGGRLGHGRQYMSWIALDDLLGVMYRCLFDEGLRGPVNAVSPEPVSNAEFTRTLGRVLGRPTIFPVPRAALLLLLGEMGQDLLLASTRVQPARLEAAGFRYQHPELESTLRFDLGRPLRDAAPEAGISFDGA